MRNFLITCFIFFMLVTTGLYWREEHKTKVNLHFDPHHQAQVIEINSSEQQQPQLTEDVARSPAQISAAKARGRRSFFKAVDPKQIELQYELTPDIYLTKNIAAIPKKSYQASMGRVIHEDLNFHYVQASENNPGKLSIYDTKRQTLQALSHIIRIPHTNEARRVEITSRGFKENLYLEKLELLFIETNTTDFNVVYEELKNEGFAPEYQILNRHYSAK